MHTHPDLTMMLARESRDDRERRLATPQPPRQPGPLSAIRARVGNALIVLGTRISPTPPRPARLPRPRPAAST